MFEVDQLGDAEFFECKVTPVANSRHIYSQARKKLALLTPGHAGHHPEKVSVNTLAPSKRWIRAGSAIYHGVRATQLAKISTAAVRRMNVMKPVGREELLHEKFANLLVMG
eukprot:Skav211064  [mRNA]  locus=scaffold314:145108:145440:- [translate_table: standard]